MEKVELRSPMATTETGACPSSSLTISSALLNMTWTAASNGAERSNWHESLHHFMPERRIKQHVFMADKVRSLWRTTNSVLQTLAQEYTWNVFSIRFVDGNYTYICSKFYNKDDWLIISCVLLKYVPPKDSNLQQVKTPYISDCVLTTCKTLLFASSILFHKRGEINDAQFIWINRYCLSF